MLPSSDLFMADPFSKLFLQDDEWKVVKDNFSMENGELTLEGFLQLHQMEADDNGGEC